MTAHSLRSTPNIATRGGLIRVEAGLGLGSRLGLGAGLVRVRVRIGKVQG